MRMGEISKLKKAPVSKIQSPCAKMRKSQRLTRNAVDAVHDVDTFVTFRQTPAQITLKVGCAVLVSVDLDTFDEQIR